MRTRTSARRGGDTRPSTQAGARPILGLTRGGILPTPAMVISYAAFARSAPDHKMSRTGRSGLGLGEKLTQKREAPAVVGPGLSCRGFTTILADRDVGT